MKKYIFYCFLLCSSYIYGVNDTILSVSFIEDSLYIANTTYVYYSDREGETIFPINETLSLLEKKTGDPLKEFVLKIDELSYNCLDTTLTVIGTIRGIEEKPLRPEKNVSIFVGASFHIEYGNIYGNMTVGPFHTVINGKPTDSYPIFTLNNWKADFALLEKGYEPTLQTFNSKFKLGKGDKYLIFVMNGYKPKVVSLTDICFRE
ncbi:MAG: hypothetical protein LBI82_06935 [Dysgonamonadaceae bacterium]|jgi:hypothetical protein|nr:hypothetical protein [Dysgonamonadaceae bacterium]